MEVTIDATGKKIGRVASEAAVVLMGKDTADFSKNVVAKRKVYITNASKADVSASKQKKKTYTRYSGYPGGLVKEPLEKVVAKKGYGEAFRKAIYGMLPANRLRSERIKNVVITE